MFWMPLEPIWEGLGDLLGSSWGLLGGSRRPLEAIWAPLGAVLGPLGMVLGGLLPQLDFQNRFYIDFGVPKGTQTEPKWNPNGIQIDAKTDVQKMNSLIQQMIKTLINSKPS